MNIKFLNYFAEVQRCFLTGFFIGEIYNINNPVIFFVKDRLKIEEEFRRIVKNFLNN